MFVKQYPRCTRKQFEFIAYLVALYVDQRYWWEVARELQNTNRLFDRQRFLEAIRKYHEQYNK